MLKTLTQALKIYLEISTFAKIKICKYFAKELQYALLSYIIKSVLECRIKKELYDLRVKWIVQMLFWNVHQTAILFHCVSSPILAIITFAYHCGYIRIYYCTKNTLA